WRGQPNDGASLLLEPMSHLLDAGVLQATQHQCSSVVQREIVGLGAATRKNHVAGVKPQRFTDELACALHLGPRAASGAMHAGWVSPEITPRRGHGVPHLV